MKLVTNLLAACFDIFPLYGREPEAARNVQAAFRLVLADYPLDKIEAAFRFHLRHNREFPVPADIATIIDRGNKPAFSAAVYVAMGRKHPEERTSEEWAYMRDYERFMVTGRG